jgi:hypothetical protein
VYGYKTWPFTLREEQRVRVLKRIFGPVRDKVTGEWRKLHDGERIDLCSSPSFVRVIKSRRMILAGHVARMLGEGKRIQRFSQKTEGKRPLGRPRWSWEDNVKMNLQEVGCGVRTGLSWFRIGTCGGHL